VDGVVQFMLQFARDYFPQCYERVRHDVALLRERFESRVRDMTSSLGDPVMEAEPDWYPIAEAIACWRRDDKTLVLSLEREAPHGAAVQLWRVTDEERSTLAEAARTRAARVAAVDFDAFFDRQMTGVAEPGLGRSLHFRMLVDDLAVIPERAGQLLAGKLRDPDGEVRCAAADVALELGGGLPVVRHLLDDPEDWVRWHVIGLLSHFGDDTAVEPLVAKLRSDPDPGMRGQAAYALGHIGSPAAIPALLHALDHDHEYDEQGHSPSSTSATALDNILGTNETRIRHEGGFCSMAPWRADYDVLRGRARELYAKWQAEQDAS
jgi:hypothetical protein